LLVGDVLLIRPTQAGETRLKAILEHLGLTVFEYRDTLKALQHCDRKEFNLVLIDGWQADRAGRRLLYELKLVNPNTPILVVLKDAAADRVAVALAAGADDCLADPFDPPMLESKVEHLLRHAMAARRRRAIRTYGLAVGLSIPLWVLIYWCGHRLWF